MAQSTPFMSCQAGQITYSDFLQGRLNPLLLLNTTCPVLANSVDPDQLASEEAN